jgi:hypothetical protein
MIPCKCVEPTKNIYIARKYHTHLQREIEKEEAREKEWKNSH